MSGLLFSNGIFLAGLAALAIPILIHLLLKQKARRFKFSTIQFFARPDIHSTQRKKLKNWLLLATRLLLLALLVTAFARPYLPHRSTPESERPHETIVFVLDRSASMQARDNGQSRWHSALDAIRKTVREADPLARFALIACGKVSEAISSPVVLDQFLPPLDRLEPEFGSSDLADGLQNAVKLLFGSTQAGPNALEKSRIYIVSDLQRSACRRLSSAPMPKQIAVQILPAGPQTAANTAIIDAQEDPRHPGFLRTSIANFSDEPSAKLNLGLSVDGSRVVSETVDLPAGANTNLLIPLPSLPPGSHSAEIRIDSNDAFALDDIAYHVLHIPEPARVLIVETRPESRVTEQESFFFASALIPSLGTSNHSIGTYQLQKCLPEELPGLVDAKTPSLIVLPALRQLPYGYGKTLSAYLKAGGAALMFLGNGVSASRYNEEFREFLPGTLSTAQGDPARPEEFWHLQDFEKESEIFSAFRPANSGDLGLPEFKRRFAVAPAESIRVFARFNDAIPMMLSRQVGTGQVILMNTSMDTSWTDWPKHKTFVPLVHGLVRYLTGPSVTRFPEADEQFLSGGTAELDVGGLTNAILVTPDQKTSAIALAGNQAVQIELSRPGIYTIKDAAGRELRRFAANIPASESDLLAHTPAEFEQQLVRADPVSQPVTVSVPAVNTTSTERHFWQALLLGGLLLLILEPIVANRMYA